MPPVTSQAVSVPEAARRLGVSPNTVRRMIRRGDLRATIDRRPQGRIHLVEMPEPTDDTSPASATLRLLAPTGTSQHVPVPMAPATPAPAAAAPELGHLVQVLDDLRQQLADAQADLMAKAEAAAMWQARAQLLEQQLALPAPAPRSWWRFWS